MAQRLSCGRPAGSLAAGGCARDGAGSQPSERRGCFPLTLDSPDLHLVRRELVARGRIARDRRADLGSAGLAAHPQVRAPGGTFASRPSRLYHFVRYIGVFAVELVRANLNMLRYVYAPRIDITPGIVKIRTRLKTPVGRLALANSIALTPGSLVIEIEGDTAVHPLARREDHRSGRGDAPDRRPVRGAPGEDLWLKSSFSSPRS